MRIQTKPPLRRGDADVLRRVERTRRRHQGAPPWLELVGGGKCVPLEAAAQHGHAAVVVELIQQLGIKGCGGASGGVEALGQAAQNDRVDVLAILTEAGVVDTGRALTGAAIYSREVSVKFLLHHKQERNNGR